MPKQRSFMLPCAGREKGEGASARRRQPRSTGKPVSDGQMDAGRRIMVHQNSHLRTCISLSLFTFDWLSIAPLTAVCL